MLLHDTLLNDDGYRSGIAETRMCSCGEDNQTVEHFLFQCPIAYYCNKYSIFSEAFKSGYIAGSKTKLQY